MGNRRSDEQFLYRERLYTLDELAVATRVPRHRLYHRLVRRRGRYSVDQAVNDPPMTPSDRGRAGRSAMERTNWLY